MHKFEIIFITAFVACIVTWLGYESGDDEVEKRHRETRPSVIDTVSQNSFEEPPPTDARIDVVVHSRPQQLKDIKVEVECRAEQEFKVGYDSGQPVAFFLLNREGGGAAIAGFIREEGDEREEHVRFSPPEMRSAKNLRFSLTSSDFSTLGNEGILEESYPAEFVQLEVFVWLDGGWRAKRAVLEPLKTHSDDGAYQESFVTHHPLVLDLLYKARMGQRDGENGQ